MHLENLADFRQMAYRLFSSILLYPEEERLKTIATVATELHKQSHSVVEFAFFHQWQQLLTTLADLPDTHTLEGQYVQVFIHSPEETPCLPYESVYVDPGGKAAGWIVASLEQEYAAAGLALSPSLKDLPDHITVELEFMAFLCGQEADAWNREAEREGIKTLEREVAFLSSHLNRWVPGWSRQVAIVDSKGTYSLVAETARTFLSHDRDLVGILLDNFRRISETDSKVVAEKQPYSGGYHHAP